MGFYTDAIRLIELAEEQLCISDLNLDDVSSSLRPIEGQVTDKGVEIPTCPANDVLLRLDALLEHCAKIASKSCEINDMLNGVMRDKESPGNTLQPMTVPPANLSLRK